MSLELACSETTPASLPSSSDASTLFLSGRRIALRPLEKRDINSHYLSWLNNPDVTRYLETGAFPQTLDDLRRYYDGLTSTPSAFPTCVFFAIQHLESGEHIGNIKLEPIHWLHRAATIGILIGEMRFQGQGLGAEAMQLCLGYAFERLGLRKVSLGVLANNIRAIRLYERIGFVTEGCKRQEYWSEGAFQDSLIMGLFREEFRSI